MLTAEYVAGFFDGEGNVGIYAGGGTGRTLRAQITQADSEDAYALLFEMRARWGGSLSAFNRSLLRNAWIYQVGGDGTYTLLHWISPYLRLKAEQVGLALLGYDHRPARTRDPATGRHLTRTADDRALTDRVAALLVDMKRGRTDAADLVEVRHTLRQIVNVKGD
jgi:hypothetical protein